MKEVSDSKKQKVLICKELFVTVDKQHAIDALTTREDCDIAFFMNESGRAESISSHSFFGIQVLRHIDESKVFEAYLNNLFGIEEVWNDCEEKTPLNY